MGGLGHLIGDLERDWGVSVGSALYGGSESYVASARTDSGADAVVKIEMPPYASVATEVLTLLAADGRGYARLLGYNEEHHATLQERLGCSLRTIGLPMPTQIEILCSTV